MRSTERPERLVGVILLTLALVMLPGCPDDDDPPVKDTVSDASPDTEGDVTPDMEGDEGAETADTDAGPELMSIPQWLTDQGNFTALLGALGTTGLDATLAGDGPFTVFAPTDDAFAALGDISGLTADEVEAVLLYHVVSGEVSAEAAVTAGVATTLNGAEITITQDGGSVTINGTATVTWTDVQATNGVIHVIDTVLIPPVSEPNAVEWLSDDGDFGTLVQAVVDAGLDTTLAGEGPFTILAPTDAAFTALASAGVDLGALTTEELTDVLTYHVISGSVDSTTALSAILAETLQGTDVSFAQVGDDVVINGVATVSMADVNVSNGVIHVIDAVLVPPGDITEVAAAAGDFTSLLAAVDSAGLTATLQGDGPFTVFAPTDAAFTALGDISGLSTEELAAILTYHVVAGKLDSSDVVAAGTLTTVEGSDATITVADGKVMIDGAEIVMTDIPASNGVIHVIDAVITPPQPNAVEWLIADGGFSTLVQAVVDAGLDTTLAGEGPFTILAPTDAAFTALASAGVDLGALTTEELTDVLTYHVISGSVDSTTALSAILAETLQGTDVSFAQVGDDVVINGVATVSMADVSVSNGVIHVIDAVLLPPGDITEVAAAAGDFTSLLGAVDAAGLTATLQGDGPFTVFAPTDAAFTALGDISGLSTADLTSILTYHVVAGKLSSADVVAASTLETVEGTDATITVGADVKIDEATIIMTDIPASNGVIHVIDAVINPLD